MNGCGLYLEPAWKLSSTGQNPCGPLAGNRDRDRRPCEGSSKASATRPVASARTAPDFVGTRSRVKNQIFYKKIKLVCPYARYALRKALRQRSTALPRGCAMISCSLGHRAEFFFVFREAEAQHTDDGRRSIHTFLPGDFISICLVGTPRPGSSSDFGGFRERTRAENCGGITGAGKCVLRNSQYLILATW